MNLIEILSILLIHWVADFVFQTDKQAKGKSNRFSYLLQHTLIYSYVWFVLICICGSFYKIEGIGLYHAVLFFITTFVFHTITDYFTSRLNSKLWKKEKTHLFFVSIGFDQYLHYIQLFVTYYLIFKI